MVVKVFAARSITVTIPSTAITVQGQMLATNPSREGVLIEFPTLKQTKFAMAAVTRLPDANKPDAKK
jgi:hypothetical protein